MVVLRGFGPRDGVLGGLWVAYVGISLEGSKIDAKPLNFCVQQGLSRDGQGHKQVKIAPGPQVSEAAWMDLIREESNVEIARRLGITDRQARRIKTGKVGMARLREHAKTDRDQQKEVRRQRLRRVRAAFILRRAVSVRPLHARRDQRARVDLRREIPGKYSFSTFLHHRVIRSDQYKFSKSGSL